MEIIIDQELYDKICTVCNNPDEFCIQAIKNYIQLFSPRS